MKKDFGVLILLLYAMYDIVNRLMNIENYNSFGFYISILFGLLILTAIFVTIKKVIDN